MANTSARLYIRSAAGYCTPPKKLVDLPTGQNFYLVWYEGDRKRARSVGRFADKAQVALINKQSELRKAAINPQAQGQRNPLQSIAPEKPRLADAATEYINRVKKSKKHRTFLAYNRAIMDFLSVVGDKSTADLTRWDILQFMDWMRGKEADDRTLHNRLTHLKTFFTEYSLPWPMLKTDRVKYTEPLVRSYSEADLKRLFAVADEEEADLFQFFLVTGGREQRSARRHGQTSTSTVTSSLFRTSATLTRHRRTAKKAGFPSPTISLNGWKRGGGGILTAASSSRTHSGSLKGTSFASFRTWPSVRA